MDVVEASASYIASLVVEVATQEKRLLRGRRYRRDHGVCTVLVAMVKATNMVTDKLPEAIGQAVEDQLRSSGKPALDAAIGGKSAKLIAQELIRIGTGDQLRLFGQQCQVWALTVCPDVNQHPEVIELCAAPIARAELSSELEARLRAVAFAQQEAGGKAA